MSDYITLMVVFALTAGFIIGLRIFFTLWGPIDHKMNGRKPPAGDQNDWISELREKRVNIRFTSGATLEDIMLEGFCIADEDAPYERPLLKFRARQGKRYYVRLNEIQFMEEVIGDTELSAAAR